MRVTIRATPSTGQTPGWQFETSGFPGSGTHDVEVRGDFPYRAGAPATPDPKELSNIHRQIHTRAPSPTVQELATLGQHLFEVAIGQAHWTSIEAAAAGAPIEIALHFEASDYRLARLPWEMLHDGTTFLAKRSPLVSVVRLATGPKTPSIEMPLRVLFVVAASPSDGRILAGAEYFGILRRLAETSGGLSHDLVVAATRETVKDAVKRFRPSVIHLIGHGTPQTALLRPDRTSPAGVTDDPCNAEALTSLFEPHPPSVVVLNICDAAGRPTPLYGKQAQAGASAENLAEGLVARGTPVVLGMAGRVADHACRLYARRLYEALAEGYQDAAEYPLINLAQACAQGRCAALKHAPGAAASVDWALPTVTMNAGLADATVRLTDKQVRAWVQAGQKLYGRTEPFCDRLSVLSGVSQWLRGGVESQPVLAFVESPGAAPIDAQKASEAREGASPPKARVGKTRLLAETAVLAAHAGFLPCVLPQPGMPDPTTWLALAAALLKALQDACDRFGYAWNRGATHTMGALARRLNPAAAVSPETELDLLSTSNEVTDVVLSTAMQRDLVALSTGLKNAGKRDLLVLLDGVHAWAPLAERLGLFVTDIGVGTGGAKVPVVLACSLVDHGGATDSVKKIVGGTAVVKHGVRGFAEESERDIAYRQFLLTHPTGRLVFDPSVEDEDVEKFFATLDELVQGVPSWLSEDRDVQLLIKFARKQGILVEANDAQYLQAGGGK